MQATRLFALVLPLTLVIGLGIGYLLGQGSTRSAPGASSGASRSGAPLDGGASERTLAPTRPLPERGPDEIDESDHSAEAERMAAAALRRAEASLSREETEATGDGFLRGVVVDGAGTPLAGATVVATPQPGSAHAGMNARDTSMLGQDLESFERTRLTGGAESILRSRRLRRVAVSGTDGRFELTELADTHHTLMAFLDGYAHEMERVRVDEDLTVKMHQIGVFRIDVRLPSGGVPEDAAVVVDDGSPFPRLLAWSPEAPEVRLESRSAHLYAVGGERALAIGHGVAAEFLSEARTIDLDADGPGPHVLELRPSSALVVDVLRAAEEAGRSQLVVEATSVETGESTPLTPSGFDRFTLPTPRPGTYEVSVRRQADPEPTTRTVAVEGWTLVEVRLEDLKPEDVVIARALSPTGGPMPSAAFLAEVDEGPGRVFSSPLNVRAKPGGEVWIPWSRFDGRRGEAVRKRTVIAVAAGYGWARAEVTGPGEAVTLRFEEPAECTVAVTGEIEPYLKVALGSVGSARADSFNYTGATDQLSAAVPESGVVELGKLQPGAYVLSAYKQERLGQRAEDVVSREVTLGPGPNRLTIEAPVNLELIVGVPGADEGTLKNAFVTRESTSPRRAERIQPSSVEGDSARFEGLVAGQYRITVYMRGEGAGEMLVDLPSPPVTFAPMRATGLVVVRASTEGPIAPANLLAGDVVVGFDGIEAADPSFFGSLAGALKERDVTLRFERDGAPMTATLPRDAGANRTTVQAYVRFRSRLE